MDCGANGVNVMGNNEICAVLAGCLALASAGSTFGQSGMAQAMGSIDACAKQSDGFTSDEPTMPVVICQRLYFEAPFVHLPDEQKDANGATTIFGSLELDARARVSGGGFDIQAVRMVDRDSRVYTLVNMRGEPLDESSALMISNRFPSNRAHYLLYEAVGVLVSGGDADDAKVLRLERLRPIILVDGKAIDERFLGAWEGTISKRTSPDTWFTNAQQSEHFAKVRVNFELPLIQHQNIPVLIASDAQLADATRYKAVGQIQNVRQGAMLSTGECAPALTGYADQNPFPDRIDPADYSIKLWRFPAMHTLWTKDFHVVLDYPTGLFPSALGMATGHNFRLKDYIATSTQAQELVFRIHGNPVDQLVISLKPVRGGGGVCGPAEPAKTS